MNSPINNIFYRFSWQNGCSSWFSRISKSSVYHRFRIYMISWLLLDYMRRTLKKVRETKMMMMMIIALKKVSESFTFRWISTRLRDELRGKSLKCISSSREEHLLFYITSHTQQLFFLWNWFALVTSSSVSLVHQCNSLRVDLEMKLNPNSLDWVWCEYYILSY